MFCVVLCLSWRSSAASAISGIALPPPSEFRCARYHRIFYSKPLIETPPPPLDRSSHAELSRIKISAIQRRTRHLKILLAVMPCHVPHAPSTLPLPRVTLSLRHVSPISTSALVPVSNTSSPRQPLTEH